MKTLALGFLKILRIRIISLMKLYSFRKRKIDIAHHHRPNSISACILPHKRWKSPERPAYSLSFWFRTLPVFHAFPNCDFGLSLNWTDKIRPLQLTEKHKSVQQVFSKFNEWTEITEDNQVLKGYVSTTYGQKIFQSVCKLRLEMIVKVCMPHNTDKMNRKIQSFTIRTFVKLHISLQDP